MRPGIDDEASPITKTICGDHYELIRELAIAIGEKRSTILRSIIDTWARSDQGDLAREVIYKHKVAPRTPHEKARHSRAAFEAAVGADIDARLANVRATRAARKAVAASEKSAHLRGKKRY